MCLLDCDSCTTHCCRCSSNCILQLMSHHRSESDPTYRQQAISSGGVQRRLVKTLPGADKPHLDDHNHDQRRYPVAGACLPMPPTDWALGKGLFRPSSLLGTFPSTKSAGHGSGVRGQTSFLRDPLDAGSTLLPATQLSRPSDLAGRSLERRLRSKCRTMGIPSARR